MWLMFTVVIDIGAYPQDWLEKGFGMLGDWLNNVIVDEQLRSLVVDGAIGGVGAVLSFVPLIVLLYLFISIIEDSGYMARAAFLIDRLMRSFGLHGKSFIPLILGFGCNVPGVMAARTLDNERDRMVTILALPFMTCGARLPVYTLLIAAFFGASGYGGTVLFGIYLLGIIVSIALALTLRRTKFKGGPGTVCYGTASLSHSDLKRRAHAHVGTYDTLFEESRHDYSRCVHSRLVLDGISDGCRLFPGL